MPEQNFSHLLSVFFRISDSPTPDKCCSREVCFVNFISIFKGYPITVVADNVSPKTLALVSQPGVTVHQTKLGNSGSFLFTLDLACKAETMFAYFSEDDYIHRVESPRLLVEGLRWSNYVTLYDHPDKYVKERGYGEVGRCLKTETWHWRQTISTTNTFGANLGHLRQDMELFKRYSSGPVPNDHGQWCELARNKKTLTVAIPGAAFNTHRVCEHSSFDWGQIWAAEQINLVAKAVTAASVFQPPPENVTFEPVDLSVSTLPNLASLGRTTKQPQLAKVEAPVASAASQELCNAIVPESRVHKRTKPVLAIPDPVAFHNENIKKKKCEVQEGNFGTFVSLGEK